MQMTCPHCKKENKVVGFFWRKPGAIEYCENKLTCGYCGQQWTVSEDPCKVPKEKKPSIP